jgi:hypothetical protein
MIVKDMDGYHQDENKYYIVKKQRQFQGVPSIIKKEFLDSVNDYHKDIGEDYDLIYVNRLDIVKAKRNE